MAEPFEFTLDEDGSLGLESAVAQAVGAASVCWESMEGTGVFQEDRATEIVKALMARIYREGNNAILGTYLDRQIAKWRDVRDDLNMNMQQRAMAVHYIDAFQEVRQSIVGVMLP